MGVHVTSYMDVMPQLAERTFADKASFCNFTEGEWHPMSSSEAEILEIASNATCRKSSAVCV